MFPVLGQTRDGHKGGREQSTHLVSATVPALKRRRRAMSVGVMLSAVLVKGLAQRHPAHVKTEARKAAVWWEALGE